MASTVFPAASAASKTRYVTTLTSGTSYTVPAGVTYVNARLFGGGGGGGKNDGGTVVGHAQIGAGGQVIETNVSTTPGNSIAYAIGAGGAGGGSDAKGSSGGNTTFTGATSAVGGTGGTGRDTTGAIGTAGQGANNGGGGAGGSGTASAGGAGKIELEYWA